MDDFKPYQDVGNNVNASESAVARDEMILSKAGHAD